MSDADQDALSKLVVASRSDVGRSRDENQDAMGDVSNSLGERLLIVADGMGGHQGGAQASQHCVQSVQRVFLELQDPPDDRLMRGLEEANADVYQEALDDEDLAGMGATAVAFLLSPDGTGWVAWVGDSRLYRLRDGELEALTEDHSLVAQWVKLGVLSAEEAADHPKRNELTRAIGVTPEVEVDLLPVDLRPGDCYLLCSDGLCGVIDDDDIRAGLAVDDPEIAARSLIDRANAAGGPDNVTVQIAWLREDEPEEDDDAPRPSAEAPSLELDVPRTTPQVGAPAPGPDLELAAAAERRVSRGSELEVPGTGLDAPRRPPVDRRQRRRRASDAIDPGHPASLLAGLLAGVALSMLATTYLRWQRPPPPMPRPLAEPVAPAAPAPPSPESADAASTPPARETLPTAPSTPAAGPAPAPTPPPEPPAAPAPEAAPEAAAARETGSAAGPAAERPATAPAQVDPGLAHPEVPDPATPPAPPPGMDPEPAGPAPEPEAPAAAESGSVAPPADVVVIGEIPEGGEIRWIPVPEPEPTADAFDVEPELRAFLDAWLRTLTRNDHAGYVELGFQVDPETFARTQAGRESYRLHAVEVDGAGAGPLRVRLVVSWAFYAPGGRRFRQEEERRFLLEPGADGLRFSGLWSD